MRLIQLWQFIFTLTTLLTFNSARSFAQVPDTCTPYRLDQVQADGSEGSMQPVPVIDQGVFGICATATAVQLVDAYRFSKLPGQDRSVHASMLGAAIGSVNLQTPGIDPLEDGSTACDIVDYMRTAGFHDAYKATRCILNDESMAVVTGLDQLYINYWVEYDAKITDLKAITPPLSDDDYFKQLNEFNTTHKAQLVSYLYQWMDLMNTTAYVKPPAKVITDALDTRDLRFIQTIEAYQCYQQDPAQIVPLPTCQTDHLISDAKDQRRLDIDAAIQKISGQPLAIGYCPQVLNAGKTYAGTFLNINGYITCSTYVDDQGKTINDPGTHASLIIGRRKNPQTQACEYLVRNSWGSNCVSKPYPITLPPELLNNPELKFSYRKAVDPTPIYSKDWECDKGNVWIDADVLTASIYKIQYFQPAN